MAMRLLRSNYGIRLFVERERETTSPYFSTIPTSRRRGHRHSPYTGERDDRSSS
jgi:hypothetical protein